MAPRVYVASPLGFSEAGRHWYNQWFLPTLRLFDLEVLDPWTLTDPAKIEAATNMTYGPHQVHAWSLLNREIGANNEDAIRRCDFVVAILDGADVDSGTASEVGFAYALGKIVVGYRGDFRLAGDNVGSIVNLQVEHFILQSGGSIVTSSQTLLKVLSAVAQQFEWRQVVP